MQFTREKLNECIIVNQQQNINLSDSEATVDKNDSAEDVSDEDSIPLPKKAPIYSAFNEL